MKYKVPRGTQDILPGRSQAWLWLESSFRSVLHRYGYQELRTPMFESTELFQRGVGESTDIVQKEMYTFSDRKGRSLTLRPEGTAAAARAYVEHHLNKGPQPVRLYYIGPMFRYERPQAGRYRQHQQVGAELFGAPGPRADFEAIALLVDVFASVGLTSTRVKLNSVGDASCRPAYTQALQDYLADHGDALNEDARRQAEINPLRVLDTKDPALKAIIAGAPSIQEHLNDACREHQEQLLALLEASGIPVQLDPGLVRGLDYYTKTVFEIQHDGLGAQSAIGGGGRYDDLVADVGGPEIPAVGFSTGVERTLLALEAEHADLPGSAAADILVAAAGDEDRETAAVLARRLRREFHVDVDVLDRGLGGQMRAADKAGVSFVLVVGEVERDQKTWTVKNMTDGSQEKVVDTELEAFFRRHISKEKAEA